MYPPELYIEPNTVEITTVSEKANQPTRLFILLPLPTTSSTATCSLSTPHPLSMLLYSGSLWNLGSPFFFSS